MSRYLLVTLHEDLPALGTLHDIVIIAIKLINGVAHVTDLAAIDQTTLDVILLKPTERVEKEEPRLYQNLRRYLRRKQQPPLELNLEKDHAPAPQSERTDTE
jgi:hypothetical protein